MLVSAARAYEKGEERMTSTHYKLTTAPLVMMIFSTVYGFANVPRAFFMMGYGAIFWYALAALVFFLPFAVMMVEFGYTFKSAHGGIYSWMARSVGVRFAFIVVFIWYTSYIAWFVSTSSIFWVPVGKVLEMFNFNGKLTPIIEALSQNSMVIGLLAILLVLSVTFFVGRGLKSVGWVASIGGTCVVLLNFLLIIGGFAVLVLNKFHFAEPITGLKSFVVNPHKSGNILSLMGFTTFAIFAYGGLEIVSGLVDKVKKPEKTFPRALILAALIIAVGYSLMIFVVGIFTNWLGVMGQSDVSLGNVLYVVMEELGAQLGVAIGLRQEGALYLSKIFSGITGLSMVLAYAGAFFVYFYSPLKQMIEGTPKKLWPAFLLKEKNDMPVGAIYVQGIVVVMIIAFNAFGGTGAKELMNRLVMMTNVAMTLPYMFIAMAYLGFRRNNEIEKPFLLIRNNMLASIMAIVVVIFVGFANLFTVFEPLLSALYRGSIQEIGSALGYTMVMVMGPILFAFLGYLLYQVSLKKD